LPPLKIAAQSVNQVQTSTLIHMMSSPVKIPKKDSLVSVETQRGRLLEELIFAAKELSLEMRLPRLILMLWLQKIGYVNAIMMDFAKA
jgi:hypothetical protein